MVQGTGFLLFGWARANLLFFGPPFMLVGFLLLISFVLWLIVVRMDAKANRKFEVGARSTLMVTPYFFTGRSGRGSVRRTGGQPLAAMACLSLLLLSAACSMSEHVGARSRSQTLLGSMTTRQKIGQMLMVSVAGTSLDAQAMAMIRKIQPGGITLFGDNFASPSQLRALDHALQQHTHIPLFISVDQEGGEVIRITSGVKQLPAESQYGAENNAAAVKSDAATEAQQLRKLGINMNLAPVLDVATPTSIMGSEERSYGPNAREDARLGVAAIEGYQKHGIAATAKHVVGLGTTTTNPETQLPLISLTPSQLSQQLLPFKKVIGAGVDSIMVTHVIIQGVTSSTTPASLSRKVVTGILREKMGFTGVLMTDSLTMGAVTGEFGVGGACTMAVHAGEDILLITAGGATATPTYAQAENAILAQVRTGRISVARLNRSVARILDLKRKLHLPLPKI